MVFTSETPFASPSEPVQPSPGGKKMSGADETTGQPPEQPRVPLHDRAALEAMPARAYLDETVVPVLMQAMSALVQERPENPVQFLGEFLLLHSQRQ